MELVNLRGTFWKNKTTVKDVILYILTQKGTQIFFFKPNADNKIRFFLFSRNRFVNPLVLTVANLLQGFETVLSLNI